MRRRKGVVLVNGKRCASCKTVFPADDFFKSSSGSGLSAYCKACSVKKQAEWSERNREHKNAYSRKWNSSKPGYCSRIQGGIQAQLRAEVINAYGNQCQLCGITDIRILTIEHKSGGGKADLRKSKSLWTILRRIKADEYPDDFTVLCRNCNMAHGANFRKKPTGRNGIIIKRVHAYYGEKCGRCESENALDLDHRFSLQHPVYRHIKPRGSSGLAAWIIVNQGWNLFQLLCHNCNWIKMLTEDSELAKGIVPEGIWHGLRADEVFEAIRNGSMSGDVVDPCVVCNRSVLQPASGIRKYCSKECCDKAYNINSGRCVYKRKLNIKKKQAVKSQLIVPTEPAEDKQRNLF
jgi:hypothetical protein